MASEPLNYDSHQMFLNVLFNDSRILDPVKGSYIMTEDGDLTIYGMLCDAAVNNANHW